MMLLSVLLVAALASAKCFEPSVAHPLPEYDPNDPLLQSAFESIGTALTVAVAAPEYASTSFSVEITSSKESLWSHHHTARERNTSRPDIERVNGDALYRIASITKAFTVLGILYQHEAGNLSLDSTVNKYIEELGEKSEGGVPWKDITLRSLASQLSGIPREFAQGDLINSDKWVLDPQHLGLPPVSRKGLIKCAEYSPNYETPCTLHDLLDALRSKAPLFAPNQKSTYSNIAFELLGLVIERVSNQSFESYINEAVFKPLNMSTSTLSLPPDSAGVIPLEPQYWDADEGIQSPTGGIYSSTSDLSKFLRYILQQFNAITHAINWIHPVSPSRGLHSFYGMPWEIFQTDRILKDSKRTVRFITKSGGLPGYTSIIMTIPEYDLGITILLAGPPYFFSKIQEIVTVAIVRAAEELSIRQLNKRYTGTYASTNSSLNSSMTLASDHRGLVITKWISNSTDVLETVGSKLLMLKHWYAQLVPTLLYREEKGQKGEEWRVQVSEERSEGVGEIWDDFCMTNIDGPLYAGVGFNELVFWDQGKEGTFRKLELSAFRANLTRVEDGDDGFSQDEEEVLEL
ncbi:beta-lactamase family protein [Cucurbitaria berberidis CBS 394.84]|uniref:Beta-lactamase family protein n=1 Tax=Cucurbitaria berberidis CBS 394.84 TaxID=1168544 RepID=A0A9P4GFY7_9PLEO|nr:beta-lactamase family protein [Cucurbitaria berberidis CBS 394.84]KAF1844541.1 beta-lactamase family protein [Cucurbitaria berberidis CBS 394.84]